MGFDPSSILPISDPSTRTLIGWLNADVLKAQYSRGQVGDEQTLAQVDQLARRDAGVSSSTAADSGEASSTAPSAQAGQLMSVRKFAKDKQYQRECALP